MGVVSGKENGWDFSLANSRVDFYYRGTRVGHVTATLLSGALAIEAGTTLTAGTGLTVTTGNSTVTAGDEQVTAGNMRLGVVSTFANTQPTSAAVFKVGTAPVGAIVTSGGVFSSSTVMRKIIAAGTASNIQA